MGLELRLVACRNRNRESANQDYADWEFVIALFPNTLDNGRNPDIGTLKKERGDIFSECCAERFQKKIIRYVNEVLIEMVKTALKDTDLVGTTPT